MRNKMIIVVISIVIFSFLFKKLLLNNFRTCPPGYRGVNIGQSLWKCLRISCEKNADCAQSDCGYLRPACGYGCECATPEQTERICHVDTDCAWGASNQHKSISCGCFNKESMGFLQSSTLESMTVECSVPSDSQKPCECYDFRCQVNKGCNELTQEIKALMDQTATCNSDSNCYRDDTDLGYIGTTYVRSHLFDGDEAFELLKQKTKMWSERCGPFYDVSNLQTKVRCKKNKCSLDM